MRPGFRPLARASLIIALAAFTSSSPAAPRDAKEKALVQHVTAGEKAHIELLEQLVNVNSGTMNLAGVRQVGDLLRPRFEALGFKVTWVDGTPFKRAGHLIATRPGRGQHVLLIGHMDTVFEPNHPFQRWQRVDENIARGPGAADDKGGIVVALAALDALRQAKLLDSLQITVVLHGDEEDSGAPLALARHDLIEAAKAADIAIGLENAADNPKTAVTARRSSTGWVVKVTAKSSHSSQIFSDNVGAGAAYELGRILNGFYQEVRGEEFVTFNPGLIASSTQVDFKGQPLSATLSGKNNIVAPTAIASGDLRTLTVQQLEETRAKMRKVVAASLPQTSAEIEFTDNYPPMAPTEGNRKLLSLYDGVSKDLGFGPVTEVNPRNAGAADISFAADHVDMALDGLGLLGGGAHTPDEFADLRTYQIQTQRLAVLLYRLGRR
ncbi:M20/M25/M40 family metallo-hydrolase [Steroidobacter sp.]|uniref:M20/M25/M40 family metallo-hydrolase n=1 Tax=Steroidobacter sp. TaxID=1978227 RepID=UPI001A385F16|nr:M20/M25/M40 family metallo-hydrolase [Steroidobacter sp.]MBL8269359.1 M20/M25/M40 family metallo-hydrolase [Steroidobacter sp.]